MAFRHGFSDVLKDKLRKLFRHDRRRYELLMKKMEEIASADAGVIEHYKTLRYDLSDRKRVHIDRNFVLTFSFDKRSQFILFLNFDHHDRIYRR
ncbi:MAG: addiction module toxin RelE [Candidatus Diapherotrites archaeon]|nr:addiction module toxin RelE [Candidatus Diapherotrites archaeon]